MAFLLTKKEKHENLYEIVVSKMNKKLNQGTKAHSQNIGFPTNGKQMVKMFLWFDEGDVVELKSEPFYEFSEAQHFSMAFDDNFLSDSVVEKERDEYFVYSGWVIKNAVFPYSLMSKGAYYEF